MNSGYLRYFFGILIIISFAIFGQNHGHLQVMKETGEFVETTALP